MYDGYDIRQIMVTMAHEREKVERLLESLDLRLEAVDYYAGIFNPDGKLVGGGGLHGDLLKCLALSPELQGTGLSLQLVSHLLSEAQSRGHATVRVFTKPKNRCIFENFGFKTIARSADAILMDNGNELEEYCTYLRSLPVRRNGTVGAIVMNANPFTLGHRHLITQAARQVGTLVVIPVAEDASLFTTAERVSMIKAGCNHLHNVIVAQGSHYAVSRATFPHYFLKQTTTATCAQVGIDLDLFVHHLAPALGVTHRFVGEEMSDKTTRLYNKGMHDVLPRYGIQVGEIPRKAAFGRVISATHVRRMMELGMLQRAAAMVPPSTLPYILAHAATHALQAELDTTPKPGLVDRHDSGAHRDMDYALMCHSIAALHPWWVKLAQAGLAGANMQYINHIGQLAEQAMLDATHGINTHKGALFSIGLTIVAAIQLLANQNISAQSLQQSISSNAREFAAPAGTHGAQAIEKTGGKAKGAMAMARDGYSQLFDQWLPMLQSQSADYPYRLHKTLLLIIATLDDTNVIYRAGEQAAQRLKDEAQKLLDSFWPYRLEMLGLQCNAQNISPGGAADMLALTLLVDALLKHPVQPEKSN